MVCKYGYLEIVKFRYDLDAIYNSGNNDCNTSLHMACIHCHLEIVKFITEFYAEINLENYSSSIWIIDVNID